MQKTLVFTYKINQIFNFFSKDASKLNKIMQLCAQKCAKRQRTKYETV